jgi:acyl carrier protein
MQVPSVDRDILALVAELSGVPTDRLDPSRSMADLGIDSFGMMHLITEIESLLDTELSDETLGSVPRMTLAGLLELVTSLYGTAP